ncbi:MAG: hypothetical protein AAGK97_15450, partial [Bacteroidota bacterium]
FRSGGNIAIVSPEITLFGLGGIDSGTEGKGNAGTINVQSDRLTLDNGAVIIANARGTGDGGEIFIQATELIEVAGKDIPNQTPDGKSLPGGIIADVGFDVPNDGGDIYLETERLTVTKGAFIAAGTKGSGDAGNITIVAEDLVEVIGGNAGNSTSQIVSAARRNTTGQGGNVAITTKNLSIRDGGRINVGTESVGNGGDLSILATGTVELKGTFTNGLPSSLVVQAEQEATGTGGDIFLAAKNLSIADGGQISASTLGRGEGGSVTVDVQDDISINGFTPFAESNNPRLSSFVRNAQGDIIPSGIFASSPGLGNADALNINANSVNLDRQAQLSVSSLQQGAAGNLSINADKIDLNNSILSAETVEGDRANIFLNTSNFQLRNQSLVTTNATQTATGGNITIDTDIL